VLLGIFKKAGGHIPNTPESPFAKGGIRGITNSHYFLYFSIIQGGSLMG
jgi:hypothetical protein